MCHRGLHCLLCDLHMIAWAEAARALDKPHGIVQMARNVVAICKIERATACHAWQASGKCFNESKSS